LVATPTNKIGLVLAGERSLALASGGGRDQTIAMLRQLAELEGCAEPDLAESLRQIYRVAGRPRDLVVLSPRTFAQVAGTGELGDRERSVGHDQPKVLRSDGGGDKRAELRSMMGGGSAWRWFSVADRSLDLLAAADGAVDQAGRVAAPAGRVAAPSASAVTVAVGDSSRR